MRVRCAYWWRLGPFSGAPPVFPEYIEWPHVTIDSDGTIYVGSYHYNTTGKLYAIWGP
ncbi:MAG: hypothetical protein HRF45_09555 [Fimbriimonadia bacterium]|jgi:hypothetical protein